MTNLFLNNYKTIAMDDPQPLTSEIDNAHHARLLSKMKAAFLQHFEPAVSDCCMRIDIEFGLQLGRDRERMSKDGYMKLLDYLRSVRNDIERDYLARVNALFDASQQKMGAGQLDFSKISLVSDDAVKENHAISQLIRQCEHSFYEDLTALNKQLALQPGKQTIADSQNPVFPEKLVRALVETVKPLKLDADCRIALYKTFEANVFSQLGFIYRELMQRCVSVSPVPLYVVGEIKEEVPLTSADDEQPSAEFRLLQHKLEQWRLAWFPSAYDVLLANNTGYYEHFEIINALQVLQQFNDDLEPAERQQPLKLRVLKKLEELSFGSKAKNIARDDEDVLDIVSLIFAEINRDEVLEDTLKTAILQLEAPLAAASLGRYSVFTHPANPVRQLLDEVFSAGLFLNLDEHDDRLIQLRIANTVKKMTRDSGFELSGWVAEAHEFAVYMNRQQQRTQLIEENARQLMQNQQAVAASRKIVSSIIDNSTKDKALPAAISTFLREVWVEVLLDAYLHKFEQPEQWQKSLQAMDELIISVMPPADDLAKKQVLKLLPGLIAELRKGLKQIAYDKQAQSRFFKDLAVWHIILMDKKEKSAGENSAVPVEVKTDTTQAIADDSAAQAENIAEGDWVAFTEESGKYWGKLIWKNAELLFVGKNGVKLLQLPMDELAEKLRQGQALIIKMDKKTITERVLSELTSL